MRPDEEMAHLLQKSLAGPILESTTCHQDDGNEFEVVTSRPRLSENLPMVISRIIRKIDSCHDFFEYFDRFVVMIPYANLIGNYIGTMTVK